MTLYSFKAYFICFCAALFYIYQFVLRVAPSVMVDKIMMSFHLEAASFSFLSAGAMYAYSLMQIPAGIYADIYGTRKCIMISLLLCISGTFLLSITGNYWGAFFSRVLIGMGSACAFLCTTKVLTSWFGLKWQSRIFGFTMTAGTIGALNGSIPIAYLLNFVSWQNVFQILGVLGAGLLVIEYFFLQEGLKLGISSKDNSNQYALSASLKEIFKNKTCWYNAFSALGIYTCISVIADLWGVNFCMNVFKFDRTYAAQLMSLIYVGLCFGSIIIPIICDYGLNRKKFIIFSLFIITICLNLFVYNICSSIFLISIFLFLMGLFAGSEMLCFTNACEAVPYKMSGTVTGFVNCVVMLGGAFLQNIFGFIMDYSWQGNINQYGEHIFTQFEYRTAFMIITGFLILSFFIAFKIPQNKKA